MSERSDQILKSSGLPDPSMAVLERGDALFVLTASTLLYHDESGTRRVTLRDLARIHSDQEGTLRVETPAGTALSASLVGFDPAEVQTFFRQVRDVTAQAKQGPAASVPASVAPTPAAAAPAAAAPAPSASEARPAPATPPAPAERPPTVTGPAFPAATKPAATPPPPPRRQASAAPAAQPTGSQSAGGPSPASQPAAQKQGGQKPPAPRPAAPQPSAAPASGSPGKAGAAPSSPLPVPSGPAPVVVTAAVPTPVAGAAPESPAAPETPALPVPTLTGTRADLLAQAGAVAGLGGRLRLLAVILMLAALGLAYFLYTAETPQPLNALWVIIAGGVGAVALTVLASLTRLLATMAQVVGARENGDG